MPEWYGKYELCLKRCKKISRANTIHLWHEETLARMRLRLMSLRKEGKIWSTY